VFLGALMQRAGVKRSVIAQFLCRDARI